MPITAQKDLSQSKTEHANEHCPEENPKCPVFETEGAKDGAGDRSEVHCEDSDPTTSLNMKKCKVEPDQDDHTIGQHTNAEEDKKDEELDTPGDTEDDKDQEVLQAQEMVDAYNRETHQTESEHCRSLSTTVDDAHKTSAELVSPEHRLMSEKDCRSEQSREQEPDQVGQGQVLSL